MAKKGFYDEDFYYGSGVLMSVEKLGTIKISPGGVGEERSNLYGKILFLAKNGLKNGLINGF